MIAFFKYLVLPLVVVGLAANFKDIRRYIKIRNM